MIMRDVLKQKITLKEKLNARNPLHWTNEHVAQ